MNAPVLLAPIIEEIANRWGFFELRSDPENGCLSLTREVASEFAYFGEKLELKDLCKELPVSLADDGEKAYFPRTVESEEVNFWRSKTRNFFRVLSEENPRELGRWELTEWDKPRTPKAGLNELPRSEEFLGRSYLGEFIVREKKPMVVDYRRCRRNYLASVDDEGIYPAVLLMDASSQIASHLLGFNGTALRCVTAHAHSFNNADYRLHEVPAERALRSILLRWAPEGMEHIAWCNSGTESWEKALHLAQIKFPDKGPKCLCFKGSFHGRTLISLFSSWNPVKRLPFQLEGFETLWAEFPEDKEPHITKDADPDWLAHWEMAAEPDFEAPDVDRENDCLLASEVDSLMEVRAHLASGEICAVSVEPMQCEGGDRFGSNRFFQSLRVLTRAMGVALIFDEVQTGFGLGGAELWCKSFGLKDSDGNSLPPDFINLAKKCQVGAVISTIPDVYKTSAHAASFCRGYVNASSVDPMALTALGQTVREKLFHLAEEFEMVESPRAQGLAFAFDLPDKEHAMNFVNQRFYHGFMVYIAGVRTLRFRIQHSTSKEDLGHIFNSINESLRHLKSKGPDLLPERYDYVWPDMAGPEHPLPSKLPELRNANWDFILKQFGELSGQRRQELAQMLEPKPIEQFKEHHRERSLTWLEFLRYLAGRQSIRIRPLHGQNWEKYKDSIMAIEREVYEPARVDEEDFLQKAVEADRSVSFVAFERDRLLGFCIASPLENFENVRGPETDELLGSGRCLYSADVLVHPNAQGRGVGLRLKRRQKERARELGFDFIRSRNRVGLTESMENINKGLGAVELNYFAKDYGADEAPCRYLTLPLQTEVELPATWSDGVDNPTGGFLAESSSQDWDLAAINKNSLCNWWTPNMTRYVEWLRSVAPLGHLYLASGRDEAVDKLIKCLIHKRKGAQTMISFQGSFWGGVTAAARSLSDPKFGNYFPWKHVSFPYQEGDPFVDINEPLTDREINTLDELGELLVEPDKVLGVAIEPIQEKTGRRVSVRFLQALRTLCDDTGVPLVMNESASWAYRGSRELFYCQATGVKPDLLTAFGGGQLGHVFSNDEYYIAKPLTLISTWDGDELSALRFREQMRILRMHRDDSRLYELDKMIGSKGDTHRGSGLLFSGGEELRCQSSPVAGGHLLFPALNRMLEEWEMLQKVFPSQRQTAGV